MLILTRRAGEAVIVNGKTRITIRVIDGNRVVLGVEAPRDIPVVREELLEGTPPNAPESNSSAS